ncbi:MAG: EAL domain-containing protein [Burkholderiales bacterium]|nr:EAL domain-containing protein [Burkholderiales bacterium]
MNATLSNSSTPTGNSLPMPALGRFGPLALAVAALAAICVGLMAWSHHSWRELQVRSHAFDTVLAQARLQSQRSQWLAEQRQNQVDPAAAEDAQPPLDNAVALATQLLQTATPSLHPAMQTLVAQLENVRRLLEQRIKHPQTVAVPQLLAAFKKADQTAEYAAHEWQIVLAEETTTQQRIDLINMGILALVTGVLLTLIGRAHKQRELATRALLRREAELQAFADAVPDLAFLLDKEGRYLEIFGNHSSALLGRPREQLIGQPISKFFSPASTALFMGTLTKALETRQTQSLSYPIRILGGQRHFDSRCSPVGDTDRVVWMIWDVTARRRAEQRLVHMTRLYDFLSQVNQAIVWSTTENDLLTHVCRAALEHGRFKKAWVIQCEWPDKDDEIPDDGLTGNPMLCKIIAGGSNLDAIVQAFEGYRPKLSGEGPIDQSIIDGRIFHTADLSHVPNRPAWADAALQVGLAGCAIIPLRREQQLMGHLLLLDTHLNAQDQDEKALFEDVASDLGFALTNLHRESLREQTEERIRLHAAALESTRDGMVVLNRDKVLVSINPAFTDITGYTEEDVLGHTPEFLFPDNPLDVINDVRQGLRTHLSWQGEVWSQRKDGELFMTKLSVSAVKNPLGKPTHFVCVMTDITQLKQTEARLAHMAHFDTLTELPNRAMIHERLAHAVNLAQRHHTLVGVVFVDLDNFKTVNDGLGHAAGDDLLRQVAQRLKQRVRQEDTLGRLGGDEFILVLEHLRHPQQAAHVAQAILKTLNQPFTLDGGQQVYVRASIGIAMYPDDGTDAAELIRDADAAMYESKRRGRNSFSFYTESFTSDATSRLHLETRLRRAVEHGEFVLHYQPMVRLTDRRVMALEALVRLKAPDGVIDLMPAIGPDEFIPVMEDTGMIVALGEWVLQEACRQGKAWLDAGLDFGRLSVNLSPSEIRRGGVVERVSRILNRTGLPADRLELEITESGLMESSVGAEKFLHMLHALGVSLSIDDFGTGYSSLAYLKRFPVHQLKIDRSFIQDLPGNSSDAQLVQTMISLARGLNLIVVAEGVEMPDQEAFLSALGCDLAQGYLFSRPVPPLQIEAMFHLTPATPSEKSTVVR